MIRGKGIAKHQTDKGGEKSQPEGFQDHIQVGSFQEFGKIPQVKESVITSFPSVVNIQGNEKQWDHKDNNCPDKVRMIRRLNCFINKLPFCT